METKSMNKTSGNYQSVATFVTDIMQANESD